jgi:hypothetical protein
MYGVSPEMLNKMYVEGSLKNDGEGFAFTVTNKIDSGSVSGIAKLSVDGEERSLEGATIQIGEKVRLVTEISWSASLYVSYGTTLLVYVPGPLAPGEHTINILLNAPELGRISIPFTDTVS